MIIVEIQRFVESYDPTNAWLIVKLTTVRFPLSFAPFLHFNPVRKKLPPGKKLKIPLSPNAR